MYMLLIVIRSSQAKAAYKKSERAWRRIMSVSGCSIYDRADDFAVRCAGTTDRLLPVVAGTLATRLSRRDETGAGLQVPS
jgi:hypothetical protein